MSEPYTQKMGALRFTLRERRDFSWLKAFGEPFVIFDKNDSGNISFGLQDGEDRYFLKYAGARTVNAASSEKEAIEALEKAAFVYEDLSHPTLVNCIESGRTSAGAYMLMEWFDGECLHDYWNFDIRPKKDPTSPYSRFLQLPVAKKLAVINDIFKFLLHVENRGYVAVDYYDGSILYDFKKDAVKICDIDLYQKNPVINNIGKSFWGSDRFKAPEEYILGAQIDSVTNIYGMGKLLELFFTDPATGAWQLGLDRKAVVERATQISREERYKNMVTFYDNWREYSE